MMNNQPKTSKEKKELENILKKQSGDKFQWRPGDLKKKQGDKK